MSDELTTNTPAPAPVAPAGDTPEPDSKTSSVDDIALQLWNEAEAEAAKDSGEEPDVEVQSEKEPPAKTEPTPTGEPDTEPGKFTLDRFRELMATGDTDAAMKLAGLDPKKISPGEWAQVRHHEKAVKQREVELSTVAQDLAGRFQHFYDAQRSIDGGDYVGAIEAMFPERDWSKVSERIINQSMNRDPEVAELARWKREREAAERQQQQEAQRVEHAREQERLQREQFDNVKTYVAANLNIGPELAASPLYETLVQNIVGLGRRIIERTGRDVQARDLAPQILRDMMSHRTELDKFITAFGGAGGGAPNPQTGAAVQSANTRVSREPTSIPQSRITGASGANQGRSNGWNEDDDLEAIRMFDSLGRAG